MPSFPNKLFINANESKLQPEENNYKKTKLLILKRTKKLIKLKTKKIIYSFI